MRWETLSRVRHQYTVSDASVAYHLSPSASRLPGHVRMVVATNCSVMHAM